MAKKKRTAPTVEQIQGPSGPPPKKKPLRPSAEDVELEVRRYIKRAGGFVKDLPEEDKKRCEKLCKKYKRPMEWTNALPM